MQGPFEYYLTLFSVFKSHSLRTLGKAEIILPFQDSLLDELTQLTLPHSMPCSAKAEETPADH